MAAASCLERAKESAPGASSARSPALYSLSWENRSAVKRREKDSNNCSISCDIFVRIPPFPVFFGWKLGMGYGEWGMGNGNGELGVEMGMQRRQVNVEKP